MRNDDRLESLREMQNLARLDQLKDAHIVEMLKSYIHGTTSNIVFPYAEQTLYTFLRDKNASIPPIVRSNPMWHQMHGVMKAFKSLHEGWEAPEDDADGLVPHYAFHFDLKPSNVLIQSHIWRVSDFGQSRIKWDFTGSTRRTDVGATTDTYAPPEYLRAGYKPRLKYDIWSLGCILLEVLAFSLRGVEGIADLEEKRKTRDHSDNTFDHVLYEKEESTNPGAYRTKRVILKFMDDLSEHARARRNERDCFVDDVVELIKHMLEPDDEKRFSATQVESKFQRILESAEPLPATTIGRAEPSTLWGEERIELPPRPVGDNPK